MAAAPVQAAADAADAAAGTKSPDVPAVESEDILVEQEEVVELFRPDIARLSGPTVVGKIQLPAEEKKKSAQQPGKADEESEQRRKKRRKRITK